MQHLVLFHFSLLFQVDYIFIMHLKLSQGGKKGSIFNKQHVSKATGEKEGEGHH